MFSFQTTTICKNTFIKYICHLPPKTTCRKNYKTITNVKNPDQSLWEYEPYSQHKLQFQFEIILTQIWLMYCLFEDGPDSVRFVELDSRISKSSHRYIMSLILTFNFGGWSLTAGLAGLDFGARGNPIISCSKPLQRCTSTLNSGNWRSCGCGCICRFCPFFFTQTNFTISSLQNVSLMVLFLNNKDQ